MAKAPPITGGVMNIHGMPTPKGINLNWDSLTPTAQFLVIGLMTQNQDDVGELPGFDLGGIARDVGNLVGDIVD